MPIDPDHPACPYPSFRPPTSVRLVTLPDHECSYLPGRMATSRAFWAETMPPSVYHRFMDAGFRRSGKIVYQPVCRGCRQCLMSRVPVARFEPSKSQRRRWRRNQDLVVASGPAIATAEKFDLYRRYQTQWHQKDKADEHEAFEAFLYESPVKTIEYTYRDSEGKLLAVGICDLARESLSTVYFYHEPAESKRGLGTFGALYELAQAKELGIPFYYLGYWVAGCGAMEYKTNFRPCEILEPDGVWRETP